MPLKIPPLTPVPIQPTSAEPFSVFVSNTPLAQTPLSGAELVPLIQNGRAVHTPPGSFTAGGGGGGASFAAGVSTGGNTSGTTAIVSSQLVLVGGNNVTLSESTNGQSASVTISAANQSAQTLGGYAVGNTTGQSSSSTFDARTLSFDGAGIASVGYSAGSIIISATSGFTQSNDTAGLYAVGNTIGQSSSTTLDIRTLSFDGAGIVSVGYSAGSIIISASDAAQSNQTLGGYAVGNTTGQSSSSTLDARTLSFDGAGIVSVGYSAGSVVISASDAAQTNQTLGAYAVGNTTTSTSSMTADARSLSFDGAGIVSVGMSGGSIVISATDAAQTNQTDGIYATGNTTGNTSSLTHDARSLTIEFDGIVSGGWSSNNSHLIVSAIQTNQTLGLIAVGNTTTSTSSMTADARSLSFDGAGIVSVGMSGGSIVISASDAAQTNQTLGLFAVGNTTTSTSSETADARSISFDGAGALSVGMSGGSVVLSVATQTNQTLGLYAAGNTTGASSSTTLDARTFSHDGAGQISVGYSAGSLIISGPPILSAYEPHQLYSGFGQSLGQNSLWFDPFNLDTPVTVSVAQLGLSLSGAASIATTATVAGSYDFALYTRQTGASSTRLSSIFTTQATFSARFSSNVSNTIAFNGVSAATGTATNLMLGNKIAQVPCVTFLSPGEYWAAHLISTASTGSAALSVSNIFQVENLSTWGQLGGTLNSQGYLNQFMDGQGTFSVTTGGFPATLAISGISAATSGVPYYNLRNFGTA